MTGALQTNRIGHLLAGEAKTPAQVSQDHVTPQTRLGANLAADGATFRIWAPAAREVHIVINPQGNELPVGPATLLARGTDGSWSGFVKGVTDGTPYLFYVVGQGSRGFKRDPHARELGPGFPRCACIVRNPGLYLWHDQGFRPPAFNDLVIYQFHIGTFYAVDAQGKDARLARDGTFLDVLDRLEYLVALGVNALQPLPIVEFETEHSLGYNGSDYFSPESRYAVDPKDLDRYLNRVNQLLSARGLAPLAKAQLVGEADQLRAFIDVCHVYGLAVLLDVVYNHAGGWGDGPNADDRGLFFLDRELSGNNNNSLYFTDQGWAGGLVFAFWKGEVRQFLIDNAHFFFEEYHVDGFRYDEVTVIDRFSGWRFCQDLTNTLHFIKPNGIHISEYWGNDRSAVVRPTASGGAGFDATWQDGLREAVRGAIAAAAGGQGASVSLQRIRDNLGSPAGFPAIWKSVQHVENHDVVYRDRGQRVPRLADPSNARSWYSRSRSRVATGLILTAPGIPMLFMGQEFLEDKPWNDTPDASTLIFWDGLATDRAMSDHLRFTRELVWLRRRQPALRAEGINRYYAHDVNRILAFHRWVNGVGRDVVVVASLNESTLRGYELGFPGPGRWLEVFNSDVYDHFVNPIVAGNSGGIDANGPPRDGLPNSAAIVIPANGLLVFARDQGD